MITGGCCHDYKQQKNIISEGISERVPTKWDIFFEMDEKKSKARLSKKGWADQYDFIIASDECYSEVYLDEQNLQQIKYLYIQQKHEQIYHLL